MRCTGWVAWPDVIPVCSRIGRWVWCRRLADGSRMSGDVHVRFCERPGVRFPRATHLIVGFQYKSDAERFWAEMRERFRTFNLELHPDKTRLIEFGRFAAQARKRRGRGSTIVAGALGEQQPTTDKPTLLG